MLTSLRQVRMAHPVKVTDATYQVASDIAEDKDISTKEAIARVFREAGYNEC